jgi:YfiR/HmsC-like
VSTRKLILARAAHAVFVFFVLAAPLAFAPRAFAEAPAVSEYDVKAAFLFNFAKFVEWPPPAFADDREPIVIAVLGTDPFGAALDRALAGKTIRGRSIVVRRFPTVDRIEACHVLFVSRSESQRFSEILARLGRSPVLTVGDDDHFAEAGGMMSFVVERNHVRFDVGLRAAREAGLNLSSELLKVARVVRVAAVFLEPRHS